MPANAGIQSQRTGSRFRGDERRSWLSSHPRFLERRNARGEFVEPFHEARMTLAPSSLETQIAIAERAGERDLPDIRNCIELRRCGLQHIERALHLSALMIEPLRLVFFDRAPAPF